MHIMAQARPLFLVTTVLLTIAAAAAAASAQTALTTPMSEDYSYVEGRTIVYDPQMLDNPFYNLSDYGSAGGDPGPVSYFNPKPKPEAKHEPKPTKSNLKNETEADSPSPAPSSGREKGTPSLAPEFVSALDDIDAIDMLTNSTDVWPPGSDDGSASSAEVPSMAAAVIAAVGYLLF